MKDDLDAAAERFEVLASEVRDINAVKDNFSGCRLKQPRQQTTKGGFTASGLTDESNGFTLRDRHVHTGNGIDRRDLSLEDPAFDGELLDQVGQLNERPVTHRFLPSGPSRQRGLV